MQAFFNNDRDLVFFKAPWKTDKYILRRVDALRLARAIRNLVKQELAAIEAANKEASTHDKSDNVSN